VDIATDIATIGNDSTPTQPAKTKNIPVDNSPPKQTAVKKKIDVSKLF